LGSCDGIDAARLGWQFVISGSWVICSRVGSVTQVQKHCSDREDGDDRPMSMSMEKRRATSVLWVVEGLEEKRASEREPQTHAMLAASKPGRGLTLARNG